MYCYAAGRTESLSSSASTFHKNKNQNKEQPSLMHQIVYSNALDSWGLQKQQKNSRLWDGGNKKQTEKGKAETAQRGR